MDFSMFIPTHINQCSDYCDWHLHLSESVVPEEGLITKKIISFSPLPTAKCGNLHEDSTDNCHLLRTGTEIIRSC